MSLVRAGRPGRRARRKRRPGRHRAPRTAAQVLGELLRVGVAAISVAAVASTGAGYWVAHGALDGITISGALGRDDPRSEAGEMNILLIGLDSRKDQDGNDLPEAVLEKLHAGDSDAGGYNTNTLILVHVGADNRVVAFSIPRDDYIPFTGVPGYDHIKIKEAYGLTKAYTADKLMAEGISSHRTLEKRSREAGRAATLRAVRNLTGVPIDYFAEVNLAGFYDLTDSLGGVEVCLNHAVYDEYSGADFPAGRQRLDGAQALAFVRQRHGLENGDLDRTHRQQAFLVSVMHQLSAAGTFTDLAKLRRLMTVVRRNVVLSEGWGEYQFHRMEALAGGAGYEVAYRTLPVLRYETIDDQSVNIVDPAAIRAEIAEAIGRQAPAAQQTGTAARPSPDTVVDVINAGDTVGLAGTVADTLEVRHYTIGGVRDRVRGEPADTEIGYGAGAERDARSLADLLGIDLAPGPDPLLAARHVRVTLGVDYYLPALPSPTAASGSASSGSTSAGSTSAGSTSAGSTSAGSTSPTSVNAGAGKPDGIDPDTGEQRPDAGVAIRGGEEIPCVN